jgi:hypothetical protein
VQKYPLQSGWSSDEFAPVRRRIPAVFRPSTAFCARPDGLPLAPPIRFNVCSYGAWTRRAHRGCRLVSCLIIPTVPDVDLWGHTMFGGEIVKAAALPTRDHFSFTSDQIWINHEWLSEVLMYGAYAGGGGAGLIALRLTMVALLLGLLWKTLRRDGVSREITLVIVMIFAMLTYPRTLPMRPQLFSLLAFAAVVATLTRYDERRRARTLAPIPVVHVALGQRAWWLHRGTAAARSVGRHHRPCLLPCHCVNGSWRSR